MIDFKKELNNDQLKVVYEGDGPCLVLSGPGSGKTRTLVYRVAYLLEKNIPSSRILLLTFTKKAAKEMLSRINNLSSNRTEQICGGTFHHVGNLFLRKYADKIGYSSNFVIIDEEDSKNLLKTILGESGKKDFLKPQVIQKIVSLSTNAKKSIEEIVCQYFSYLDNHIIGDVSEIHKLYKERKKKNGLMDYDDLLTNWNKILDIPEVCNKLSENFLYVLVDEYQDTNILQDEIIKKISKKHKNILVVGDDAQSIYSFRAANIENILRFKENYKNSKTFRLEKNYRSTPEILEIANNVIEQNAQRLEKNLKSTLPKGSVPVVLSFANPQDQASFIADAVEKEQNFQETAVLFRAHHHAVELELELARRKIPYVLRGGVRFFEQFHIKDVVAFLRVFLNFYDEPSWRRLLLRQEKIGEVTAKKIIKEIFTKSSIESVLKEKKNMTSSLVLKTASEKLDNLLCIIEKAQKEDVPGKIDIFLKDFYQHYIETSFENAKERKSDLKKIREISSEYDTLEELISDFSLSEDFQKEDSFKEGIVLSTVHQAKGLEWETVFVISLKEGDFPHIKSMEDDLLEEERRLFYVAITRCKKNLFLTYPLYSFREKYSTPPSRFLKEINLQDDDEEIVEDEQEWEIF